MLRLGDQLILPLCLPGNGLGALIRRQTFDKAGKIVDDYRVVQDRRGKLVEDLRGFRLAVIKTIHSSQSLRDPGDSDYTHAPMIPNRPRLDPPDESLTILHVSKALGRLALGSQKCDHISGSRLGGALSSMSKVAGRWNCSGWQVLEEMGRRPVPIQFFCAGWSHERSQRNVAATREMPHALTRPRADSRPQCAAPTASRPGQGAGPTVTKQSSFKLCLDCLPLSAHLRLNSVYIDFVYKLGLHQYSHHTWSRGLGAGSGGCNIRSFEADL